MGATDSLEADSRFQAWGHFSEEVSGLQVSDSTNLKCILSQSRPPLLLKIYPHLTSAIRLALIEVFVITPRNPTGSAQASSSLRTSSV